jgi:methylthioxylose transferase
VRASHAAVWAWAALVAIAASWGAMLLDEAKLFAAPLFGRFDIRLSVALAAPVAVGSIAIAVVPLMVRTLRWRSLLGATFALSLVWIVALAASSGLEEVARPLDAATEQLAAVDSAGSPLMFLSTYTDSIEDYPLHTQGHPPGGVLFLHALAALGVSGPGPVSAVVILVAATVPLAVLLGAREVVGERFARRAAPFLAVAPAAVWIGTSMDALFMTVGAWGVALAIVAGRRVTLAIAAGALFGAALFLSYGIAPLALVPVAVCVGLRRWRTLLWAAGGAMLVVAAFAAAAFWWLDGLSATVERYRAGVSADRPYNYFVIGNLAAFAVALGPAAASGLARLRSERAWLICAPAVAAVMIADLSGLSKGEVERIWLPFLPWVLVVAGSLVSHERRWLAAQVACALAIQIGVSTPW